MSINNEKEVKKYITELEAENTTLKSINTGLAEMVEELKEQLAGIKYLSEDEVRKIISENCYADGMMVAHYGCGTEENPIPSCFTKGMYENMVALLCKLGLPTKDKIIEVLNSELKLRDIIVGEIYSEFKGIYNEVYGDLRGLKAKCKTIASNIISKYGEWEVIASGEVNNKELSDYFELWVGNDNEDDILDILKNYNGKQIEVGIRIIDGK